MRDGGRIWLIGGTSESAVIARLLTDVGIPCIVTVTTNNAELLYPQTRVLVGKMSGYIIPHFLHKMQIRAIVDATHPYAVAISQLAIAACAQHNIPYLRYERSAMVDLGVSPKAKVIELESFDTLLQGDYLHRKRVLLTIGVKTLPAFKPWQNRCTLFARVLPEVNSLQVAIEAGFTSDRLFALRPPISAAMEKALWEHWQISLVVTKANGSAGGEDVKRSVAEALGIPLIVIARPQVAYPRQTSDFAAVLRFCRQHILE
ncbi:MAG: cobalt-precorrin-6A reductase [Prochloron sp. SP5CPC1]|nr:cobalt-precorrin-6A reductase [Candidatus Paraprochloron terpiosi SP5CPC1]